MLFYREYWQGALETRIFAVHVHNSHNPFHRQIWCNESRIASDQHLEYPMSEINSKKYTQIIPLDCLRRGCVEARIFCCLEFFFDFDNFQSGTNYLASLGLHGGGAIEIKLVIYDYR